ncbi:MAG: 50S ribosomal protein L18 [Nitrospirota bacterium]|jgi:large subunit ribosomal protein L18
MKRLTGRSRRAARVRKKVSGGPERPRLSIFRSNKHIYAQVVDDVAGHTLAAASTIDEMVAGSGATGNKAAAAAVGALVAQRALEKGISSVVFDRGGYKYCGRVASLADAAREAGLKF